MEIRAKLSLAVNDFKSGLNTAKKELDSFGTSGSKFNSKFAKDIRGSFDQLTPNLKREGRSVRREFDGIGKSIKSSVKGSLTGLWTPVQQGLSKAVAKMRVEGAVVGSIFKTMNSDARSHYSKLDGYINKNFENTINSSNKSRVAQMQNLTQFEKKVSSSNRRMAREAMLAEYGAKPSKSGTTAGLPTQKTTADPRKAREAEYTQWWAKELNRRIDYTKRADSMAMASSVKANIASGVARVKTAVDSAKSTLAVNTKAARESLSVSIAASRAETSHAISSARNRAAAVISQNKAVFADSIKSAKVNADWRIAQVRRELEYRKQFNSIDFSNKVKMFDSAGFEKSMAATRYALYDVGQRFVAFGAVVVSALAQAVQASAQFESSFTAIERSTGQHLGNSAGAAENLRAKLIELSTTIPVSFEQIARIATLGAQMGISADSVDNFAETVSKFSAITGISAEQAAQSFGRLGQLLNVTANEFENLSSAITYTGVNSVATDQEILNMSESIAAAGRQAGFSADEVIGMSAALASLKVRPEEARGVLARLFREIDLQVSTAGAGLDDFSKVLGTTSEDAANLWKQDPSGFFSKFLEGAQATGKLNQTLVALGITNTREMNVIQRLSQNTGLLTQTMADAEKQYLLGTYSTEAYGLVVDDLNSKFTILQSTLAAMQASFGDAISGGVKVAVDILTGLAKAIGSLPTGVKGLIAVLGVLAATAAFLFGGIAIGIAGLLAMKLALKNLAAEGVKASISMSTFTALLSTMIPVTGRATSALGFFGITTNVAANGVKTLAFSMRTLWMATGIGVAIVGLSMLFDVMGNSANKAGDEASKAGDAMLEAGGGAEAFAKALAADSAAIAKGADSIGSLTMAYDDLTLSRLKDEQQALAVGKAAQSITSSYQSEADATGKLVSGVEAATKATAAYNETIGETDGLTKEVTMGMGAQTAAFFIDALSKYKGANGDQATFWEGYLDPDNAEMRKTAEAFGFNVGEMTAAGIKKSGGATEYLAKIQQDIKDAAVAIQSRNPWESQEQAIDKFGQKAGWTAEKIAAVRDVISKNPENAMYFLGIDMNELGSFFGLAATGVDGLRSSAEKSQAVIDAQSKALQSMGYSAEVADGLVGGLSEELKGFMDAAFAGELATNKAADAFGTYVEGANDVSDGLSGARQDTANWISYMDAAREAAVANGTGFAGSVKSIVTGIAALAAAGKDTKKPFEDMKKYILNATTGSEKGFGVLREQLKKATDPESMKTLITAWLENEKATNGATTAAYKYGTALLGALSVDPEMLKLLITGIGQIGTSAGKAKTALEKLQEAIEKVLNKQQNKIDLQEAFYSLSQSIIDSKKQFSLFSESGRESLNSLRGVIDALSTSSNGNNQVMANNLANLKRAMLRMGITSKVAFEMVDAAMKATGKTGKTTATGIARAVAGIMSAVTDTAKDEIKTLSDWVSDLSTIMGNAFELRYGQQSSMDKITEAWYSVRDAADSAKDAVKSAKTEIATLKADKSILEYQLGVAVKYGDTLRAASIRAKLATTTESLAEQEAKLVEAQDEASMTLVGTSKAAIKNRATVRGLVGEYNNYLTALASSGISNEQLKIEAAKLANEFMLQGKTLGFAESELQNYVSAFSTDFVKIIDRLPKDLTLTVSGDPALRALSEFIVKFNKELANKIASEVPITVVITPVYKPAQPISSVDTGTTPAPTPTTPAPTTETGGTGTGVYDNSALVAAARALVYKLENDRLAKLAEINAMKASLASIPVMTESASPGLFAARRDLQLKIASEIEVLNSIAAQKSSAISKLDDILRTPITAATGGLIRGAGSGTSDSIPARLSNGEYVVKAAAVKHYGTDFMNALNQMQAARPMSYANVGSAQSGSSMVYLSPEDRQLLRAAIDRPVNLYTENTRIAASANAGNVVLAQRGSK